jgi:hypothetical protein
MNNIHKDESLAKFGYLMPRDFFLNWLALITNINQETLEQNCKCDEILYTRLMV